MRIYAKWTSEYSGPDFDLVQVDTGWEARLYLHEQCVLWTIAEDSRAHALAAAKRERWDRYAILPAH